MEYYNLKKKIPLVKEIDVLIAGGGPAGFAAGIAAARNGTEVIIVERFNCLGGAATAGLVGPFMSTAGDCGGIYKEFLFRLNKIGGRIGKAFSVEHFKYLAQIMCEEENVKLFINSYIVDVMLEGNQLKGVIIINKGGLQAIGAKVVIDATGDGDVAFLAGALFEMGDKNGECQSTSMMFHINGFNKKTKKYLSRGIINEKNPLGRGIGDIKQKFKLARSRGEINLPDFVDTIWGRHGSTIQDGELSFNVDMTWWGVNGVNPKEINQADIEGRKYVWECLKFIHKYIPDAKNTYISRTPFLYGIRESRRILGDYYLTREDVLSARKFKDGIAKGSFHIDIHGPETFKEGWKRTCVPKGDWYEISYRCLLPKDLDFIITSGRCISSDHDANSSLRVMPICMATGQAAGIAAAISVKDEINTREIKGERIRKLLISQGADL